jgi:hypothetical protein
MCMPAHDGCCKAAPLRPHLVQCAERRSRSLEASDPHLMMTGTKATGLRCMRCSHTTQHHGVPRRSCSRVGVGGRSMFSSLTLFEPAEQPRGLMARRVAGAYILSLSLPLSSGRPRNSAVDLRLTTQNWIRCACRGNCV